MEAHIHLSKTILVQLPSVQPDTEQLISLLQSTGSDEAKRYGPEMFEKMNTYHPKSLIGIYHFLELIHFTMEKDSALPYFSMH
jgi:hypothetical protein